MGKNVAVFVDVANIFYAAKAAGVDIDYVTLLRSASAGRDLVRAYAYTGLDPDNENQRNFHSFLARNGYKVVSKDIRKYGDGKVKANLDIELVVDMMKTARNLDIAIVVSGDGDFAPAIRAVQEMGVRCEVISFRGNTSSDLIEVADLFTDITQLAKVEKGSRSGRRVAEDDQDLSMTEVPDKQTEGTGRGRGRGRGRDRDREPAVAAAPARGRGRRKAADEGAGNGSTPLVALPGERLSKTLVGGLTEADLAAAEVFTLDEEDQELVREGPAEVGAGAEAIDGEAGDAPRRRRRRGGRGRGRGRGRSEGEFEAEPSAASAEAARRAAGENARLEQNARSDRSRRRTRTCRSTPRPRSTPFGSVWDSQLGTSSVAPSGLTPLPCPTRSSTTSPRSPSTSLRSAIAVGARAAGTGTRGAVARAAVAPRTSRRSPASGSVAAAGGRHQPLPGRQRANVAGWWRRWLRRRAATRPAWRTRRPSGGRRSRAPTRFRVERGSARARGDAAGAARPESADGRRGRAGRGRGSRRRGSGSGDGRGGHDHAATHHAQARCDRDGEEAPAQAAATAEAKHAQVDGSRDCGADDRGCRRGRGPGAGQEATPDEGRHRGSVQHG